MKYRVKKIYKYTVEVIVEADSEREARDIADTADGERNYDDWLYDCEVIGTVDDDEE